MRPEEYMAFDAMGLAELVHRGEVTPSELADAAIERIDALDPTLNAVVERDYAGARAAARTMDTAAPLAGVPFLANPDLPDRYARHAGFNTPDQATFYAGEDKGYVDYPALVGA